MIDIPKYKWKTKERTLEEIVQDYTDSVSDAYESMDSNSGDMFVSDLQTILREFWRLKNICNTLDAEKEKATIPTRY
tara:strand:+ start:3400 stop:3630 length:231 start_codon:yes stop_codon:yes gene_type:complete